MPKISEKLLIKELIGERTLVVQLSFTQASLRKTEGFGYDEI